MPVKKQGCESSFDRLAVRFRLAGMGSDLRWRTWKHVFWESASRFTRLRSQLHHVWSSRLAGMVRDAGKEKVQHCITIMIPACRENRLRCS
jgi:hypothetical protein